MTTILSAEALESLSFEPLTEMPPYAAFAPGTQVGYAHIQGPVAEPGEIAAMQIACGGFDYTDIPGPESGFLVTGRAWITQADDRHEVHAGEGYILPVGFTGSFVVDEPTTKVFYVL